MQQTQNPWWKKIQTLFARNGEFRRNPRLAWKTIVFSCLLGMFAVLTFGYFTYYRAVQVDDSSADTTVPRSALRAGDVKAVIDTYQRKKEQFTRLLSDEPKFLSPEKGAVARKEESLPPLESGTSSVTLP